MLTGSILSSCSGGLVKKDIIIEDFIKIPKQDGRIIVYTDEDNDNCLDLKLIVENIKTLKESDIHSNSQVVNREKNWKKLEKYSDNRGQKK